MLNLYGADSLHVEERRLRVAEISHHLLSSILPDRPVNLANSACQNSTVMSPLTCSKRRISTNLTATFYLKSFELLNVSGE